MQTGTTCCFTGHRPNKLPWGTDEFDPRCLQLKSWLLDAIGHAYDQGCRHFLCGMALGCDTYFCEAVLRFRETHPDVTLEADIPCKSQADRWKAADRERYRRLVAQCDLEVLVQEHYDRGCMLRRDRYMISRSQMVIAAYNGTPGGTMQTVAYALRAKLPILRIDPDELRG